MSLVVTSMLGWLAGCSGTPQQDQVDPESENAQAVDVDVEIPTATYTWDVQAGDPAVTAELGGPGFTGEGWTTKLDVSALGRADAPQGGELVLPMPDWPATLRFAGKDWNSWVNYHLYSIMMSSLLTLDQVTLEFVPMIATHWQISDDRTTYRFRINPEATWNDGTPITSADVLATYDLMMDEDILEPSSQITFSKMERPTAVSKYIVEVKAKTENWRNFLYFSGMLLFPAHQIADLDGGEFLDKYQFAYPAVSGPYHVKPEDIVTNQSVTATRNRDWWGNDNPVYAGMYNLDRIKYVVVKDVNLTFEKLKKGEIDYYAIPKAQWYAEELPRTDPVKRGLLVRRKFYTQNPVGVSGIAINTTRPPLDELPIRKALQLLYDRDTMIKKLYFNEYEPMNSYYQAGVYQNPTLEPLEYDPVRAVQLLEEAGFTEKNDEGYRVRDGKELKLTVMYRSSLTDRSLTMFQEDCRDAGIRLELQLLTAATGWKNLRQREYDIATMNWGAILFPNPESSYSSKLATTTNNNNITAFANERVDELLTAYDREYDQSRREEIIQEIDRILYDSHNYVLGWYNPAQRVVYWNKYGQPEPWGSARYSRNSSNRHLTTYWWYDEAKAAELEAAMASETATMETPDEKVTFWPEWAAAQQAKPSAEATEETTEAGSGAE